MGFKLARRLTDGGGVMPTCETCIWLSDGFGDDERGAGWCYSYEDYMDFKDTCPDWQQSLRSEPVNDAPLTTPLPPIEPPEAAYKEEE